MERFWSKVDKSGDCWEWLAGKNKKGYGQFHISRKQLGAHRVSWELTNSEIPEGLCVLHRCDNPGCVNPDHLFLGTAQDNSDDKISKGRDSRLKGEDLPQSKLTWKDVREIRSIYPLLTQQQLATAYGVGQASIWEIVHNMRWKVEVLPNDQG